MGLVITILLRPSLPRNQSHFAKSGFANLNRLQGTLNNVKEMICQICLKTGHTADVCWNRFVEDYMSTSRGFGKGKGLRATYLSNFDGFAFNPSFDDYDNLVSLIYNSAD